MPDDLTKEQRHKNMQHIRSNDTKIEVVLRKALWKKGYRYRKNYKDFLNIDKSTNVHVCTVSDLLLGEPQICSCLV